jgi:hypothetical protein
LLRNKGSGRNIALPSGTARDPQAQGIEHGAAKGALINLSFVIPARAGIHVFQEDGPRRLPGDGHIRASLATSPGGKEHGSNKQHGNVGYSVRQPRYLRYLSKTGGFASPPLGGFALSLSKAGQSGTAFPTRRS